MKCQKCGREIKSDSMFCKYCGTRIQKNISKSTDTPNHEEYFENMEFTVLNRKESPGLSQKPRSIHPEPENELENTTTSSSGSTSSEEKEEPSIGYYFANLEEFLIYVKAEEPQIKVLWLSGDNYISEYKKGFALVEEGNLNEAVRYFNKAITFNPIAIEARFELVFCYFGLQQTDAAVGMLHYMEKYLARPKDIAHYYRYFGHYFVEKKDYKRAAASYSNSLRFEAKSTAFRALSALVNSKGIDLKNEDIDELLKSGGAALLSPWYDEISPEAFKGQVPDDAEGADNRSIEPSINCDSERTTNKKLICKNCHNILPADSEFCQYCGVEIKANTASSPAPINRQTIRNGTSAKSEEETINKRLIGKKPSNNKEVDLLRSRNKLLHVIIGLLLAIIALLVAFMLKPGEGNNASTDKALAEQVVGTEKAASSQKEEANDPSKAVRSENFYKKYSVPWDIQAGDYKIRLAAKSDSDYARIIIYDGKNITDEFFLVNSFPAVKDMVENNDNVNKMKYIYLKQGNSLVIDGGTSDIVFEKR